MYFLRIMWKMRHCSHSVCDVGPRLGSDPHYASHHLTERHIYCYFVITQVSKVQRWRRRDWTACRCIETVEDTVDKLSLSLLYSLPMYHDSSPRSFVGNESLRALITISATLCDAEIWMPSTWITIIATTSSSAVTRKTHGSTRLCSNPTFMRVDTSNSYHVLLAYFKPKTDC